MVPSVLCVDVGSTFTKAVLVDVATGDVLGTASHPTTVATDVMDGVDAVRASLAVHGEPDDVLVCSSAGGGLRLAVVGYEREVTAEAGHRVGLSAGAKVVHVACGPMTGADVAALRAASPDLVLLVGGTDGGNADVLLHNAERIAKARLSAPVVVAGNADAAGEVAALLASTGRRHVVTANVLPRIGVVAPEAARAAIREAFLTHVIGGKGLSRGRGFAELVRAPTPDAVLRGVEVLADVVGGRRARRRRRWGDDGRLLGDHPAGRGRHHPPRGRRHALARPHRRGRPRDAVDGGRCGGGWRS